MRRKKIDCGGPSATYCRERQAPPSHFDKRSLRTVKQGKARIVIGCPKGKWDQKAKRCRVGTRAQTILRPMNNPKCGRCHV